MNWIIHWALVMLVLSLADYAYAKPYVPASENQIIYVFETPEELSTINKLREKLKVNPGNYEILNRIIVLYLKLGREKSDPRYFGYAEALLTPYLKNDNLPETIVIHWADILQHQHRFDEALLVLNEMAKNKSSQSQVYLMRAIIYLSQGDYKMALNNCKSLISRASNLLTISCVSQVKSLTGKLQPSFDLLEDTIKRSHNSEIEERVWALTILADMAIRIGDFFAAEKYYLQGWKLNSKDYYILANYTDLLLKKKQYKRVISLLGEYTYVDSLLLRLAIASRKSGSLKGEKYVTQLESIYKLSELRGEKTHLRDHARFYFEIKNNIKKAYYIAKLNSNNQKDPEDVKLLLKIYLKYSHNTDDAIPEWVFRLMFEDVELTEILTKINKL
jgi:tetratricopeptide (TPR) repeat protein